MSVCLSVCTWVSVLVWMKLSGRQVVARPRPWLPWVVAGPDWTLGPLVVLLPPLLVQVTLRLLLLSLILLVEISLLEMVLGKTWLTSGKTRSCYHGSFILENKNKFVLTSQMKSSHIL